MNWTDRNHERNGASHRPVVLCCADATPAASAVPLTGQPPRELAAIDRVPVSRTALAAGRVMVTDRIVEMIRELSLSGTALAAGDAMGPVASAIPLTMIGELSLSGTALAAGSVQEPAASASPLTMIGELSQ